MSVRIPLSFDLSHPQTKNLSLSLLRRKGVLTQLSICTGLSIAQGISIPLSQPQTGNWRIIPLVSASLAGLQILMSKSMIESPFWLAEQRKNNVGGRIFDIPDEFDNDGIRGGDDEEAGEFLQFGCDEDEAGRES